MFGRLSTIALSLGILGFCATATAQTPSGIAATVGNDPIEVAEAERLTAAIFPNKRPEGEALAFARAQVLEEIVRRRLVLAHAARLGDAPGDEELAKAKKQLQARLAAQGRRVSDVLKAEAITEADLDRQVLWRLVWDAYLARYRTPQRREAWFAAHHREVDGTELVVSQILLQLPKGADKAAADALTKQAEAIRAEIESGKLDFPAAARKYSAGPSREKGGQLGKIGRQGPMDEAFSRAAFALKVGRISSPVGSPFGLHLIRCDGEVPGSKKLSEVARQVDDALAKELLEKMSDLERKQTAVKYTAAWPHFKPGTHEVEK